MSIKEIWRAFRRRPAAMVGLFMSPSLLPGWRPTIHMKA